MKEGAANGGDWIFCLVPYTCEVGRGAQMCIDRSVLIVHVRRKHGCITARFHRFTTIMI